MWGWILFGTALLTLVPMWWFASRERNRICAYTILLLLKDDLRRDHQEKFLEWVASQPAISGERLASYARIGLTRIADQLSEIPSCGIADALWLHKNNNNAASGRKAA